MKPEPPTPPQKPRTGVTRYDPEFAVLICERIATNPQSLVALQGGGGGGGEKKSLPLGRDIPISQ